MGIFVGRADNENNTRGFTLVELLTVVLITAVLLAIATPSFSEFRLNQRMTSAANELLAAVQLARTEAAKRQQTVSVCPIADPQVNEPACSGGPITDLPRGWLVFVDPNQDCTRVGNDAIEPDVSRGGPADPSITARAAGACVSFGPNGFLRNPPVALLLCDSRGMRTQGDSGRTYARGLALSRSGGARITRDAAHIRNTLGLECS